LVAALSEKVRDGQLVVVDKLDLEQPKTREMAQALEALGAGPSVLLVADGADPLVLRSAKNISRLKMLPASLLNCLDILNHSKIVMTVEAVRRVEELWGGRFLRRKSKLPVAAGGA
jgi:large subunit ribosomal protein L4